MNSIRISRRDYESLRAHLFRGTGNEEAAFLIAGCSDRGGAIDLLVREVIPVPVDGLLSQGPGHLDIDPDFMMPIIKRCRLENLSLIDVHSHPGGGSVGFSAIDDAGDSRLLPKIQQRVPDRHHASLVLNRNSINARLWRRESGGPEQVDRVVVVGQPLEVFDLTTACRRDVQDTSTYDRQILMFGQEGQRLLRSMTVAVVGCGGTGSLMVQHLSRLGVGYLILVDHDLIERSNCSRVVGATEDDVLAHRAKVEIAEREARKTNAAMCIDAIQDTVLNPRVAMRLLDADIIVCCTDTVASRMVLNRIAFQYLRPLVDCGIDIRVTSTGRAKVLGRVTTVTPDGACLSCLGVVDPDAVADELADPDMRAGYVDQADIPDPSVITLNGVVSSLAATEVLDLVVGFRDQECTGGQIVYYGHKAVVETADGSGSERCSVCAAVRAAGDHYPLPCPAA